MSTKKPSATRQAKREGVARYKRLQEKRKMVMVPTDPQMMAATLIHGTIAGVVAEGLPKDAVPMGWQYEPRMMTMLYIFGHETFKPIKVGNELPIQPVTFKRPSGEQQTT